MRKFLCFLLLWGSVQAGQQRLVVMRHGEASNNVEKIYNSNPDNPNYKPSVLTEEGKRQVEQSAQDLLLQGFNDSDVVVMFSSPLPRCVQTAEILVQKGVAAQNRFVVDKRLIERDVKDLEGKPSSIVSNQIESSQEIESRVRSFLELIHEKYPEGDIIVVTHSAIASELVELIVGKQVKLHFAETVVLPLSSQNENNLKKL